MMSTPLSLVKPREPGRSRRCTNGLEAAVGCSFSERRSQTRTPGLPAPMSKSLSACELTPLEDGTVVPLATPHSPPAHQPPATKHVDTLVRDIRYSARKLMRTPGFTAI